MKIKSTAQLFGVGLGTALGSLALMSAPAFSATLNFFGTNEDLFLLEICEKNGGTPNDPNCDNIEDNIISATKNELQKQPARDAIADDLRIAELQGRSAAVDRDSIFLGKAGSNSGRGELANKVFNWENGDLYYWTLDWTPDGDSDGTVRFSIFDKPERGQDDLLRQLTHPYKGDFNTFNALGLITRADNGQAAKMDLSVTSYTVNNQTIDTSSDNDFTLSSESDNNEPSFQKKYFLLDDLSQDITQLTGTFAMSWNGDRPTQSRVYASIRLYDPDGEGNAQTTPEPGLMLGLLGVGTLGLVGRKRKMDAK